MNAETALTVLAPGFSDKTAPERLKRIFHECVVPAAARVICNAAELAQVLDTEGALRCRSVLFAAQTGPTGINLGVCAMLDLIRRCPGCLEGSCGAILVDGETENYTKAVAREIAFSMNFAGCLLIGKPLVEGTGSLYNFRVTAGNLGVSLEEAYRTGVKELITRLLQHKGKKRVPGKNLLVLHASSRKTSNTLRLWELTAKHLPADFNIREIPLRNGEVKDCIGCHFNTCMYFSSKSSCFFGGSIVEEVYPALESCDALVMLCPNYNDAVGANLTATINRLTALFRKTPFYDKYLFAVIVSGYSGGDLVAGQLIGALNMNKAFMLPPYFAMMETANDANTILQSPGIEERAEAFAERIRRTLQPAG